jgi:hypothetical protein
MKMADQKTKKNWLKKSFNIAASLATGAAVAFTVKTLAAGALASAGLPVMASALCASAIAGAALGSFNVYKQRTGLKKQGQPLPPIFNKNALKTIATHSVLSLAGGFIFLEYGDDIKNGLKEVYDYFSQPDIQPAPPEVAIEPGAGTNTIDTSQNETGTEDKPIKIIIEETQTPADSSENTSTQTQTSGNDDLNKETPETPEAEAPPKTEENIIEEKPDSEAAEDSSKELASPEETAPSVPEQTPAENLQPAPQTSAEKFIQSLVDSSAQQQSEAIVALEQYMTDHNIQNEKMLSLAEKAKSGSGQALKDLAAIINTHGKVLCIDLPKDKALVMELYEAAIAKENTQAVIDYAYIQHFGHNGLEQNKQAAISLIEHVAQTTKQGGSLNEIAKCFHEQWTQGFDGRVCAQGTECAPATEPQFEKPPLAPEQPVEKPPVDTPPSSGESSSEMNCDAIINNEEIKFVCDLDGRAPQFKPGDKVIIDQRNMDFILRPRP